VTGVSVHCGAVSFRLGGDLLLARIIPFLDEVLGNYGWFPGRTFRISLFEPRTEKRN
jgi:hypothetical protein